MPALVFDVGDTAPLSLPARFALVVPAASEAHPARAGNHDHPIDRAIAVAWAAGRGRPPRIEAFAPAGTVVLTARAVAAEICPHGPSSRIRQLVSRGWAAVGYKSENAGEWALACAAQRAGLPDGFLAFCLADPACALGAGYRSLPASARRRRIERLTDGAAAEVCSTAARRRVAVDAAAAHLKSLHWPARTGATDLAVAEALVTIARRSCRLDTDGSVLVAAATAQVAVDAGVATETARRSLRRLLDAGVVTEHAAPTSHLARVYRLHAPAAADRPPVPTVDLGGDAARWRGLGKVGAVTLRCLLEPGGGLRTTRDVAAELGISARTARARLWRLKQLGVVELVDGRYWRGVGCDLDQLAKRFGTDGARARARMAYTVRRRDRARRRNRSGR